jgi:hypothetical protein
MALISHGIQSQSLVWLHTRQDTTKKHGRYLFGDKMISTLQVSPDGQPLQRRRPNVEDVKSFEQQLQAEMEQRLQQQHEEMEQKLEQEREEMDRKLHQECEEMERK